MPASKAPLGSVSARVLARCRAALISSTDKIGFQILRTKWPARARIMRHDAFKTALSPIRSTAAFKPVPEGVWHSYNAGLEGSSARRYPNVAVISRFGTRLYQKLASVGRPGNALRDNRNAVQGFDVGGFRRRVCNGLYKLYSLVIGLSGIPTILQTWAMRFCPEGNSSHVFFAGKD